MIDFEFGTPVGPLRGDASGEDISERLADGSFLGSLMLVLTSDQPQCVAWAQSAFSERVLEAVEKLIRAAAMKSAQADGSEGSSPAVPPRQNSILQKMDAFIDITDTSSLVVPERSEVGQVELSADVPMRALSTASFGTKASCGYDATLSEAVVAVVDSLCDHAKAAPPMLCRIVATLNRQLRRRFPPSTLANNDDDDAAADPRKVMNSPCHDLIGTVLFGRWLVPALLSPGRLGGPDLGVSLQTEPSARATLTELAKLLKTVACGSATTGAPSAMSSGDTSSENDDSSSRQTRASPIIRKSKVMLASEKDSFADTRIRSLIDETDRNPVLLFDTAKKIREQFIDVLIVRGESEMLMAGTSSASVLPCDGIAGFANVDVELEAVNEGGDGEAAFTWPSCVVVSATDIATVASVLVKDPACATVALTVGLPKDVVQNFASTGSLWQAMPPTTLPISVACWLESGSLPTCLMAGSRQTPIWRVQSRRSTDDDKSAVGTDASGEYPLSVDSALVLLRQVLAEPQPLQGRTNAQAPLTSELAARELQTFGFSVPQRLRAEIIAEWLRGGTLPASEQQALSVEREESLLHAAQFALAKEKSKTSAVRRALCRLHMVRRVAGLRAAEAERALRHMAKVSTEFRCGTLLQSLWGSRKCRRLPSATIVTHNVSDKTPKAASQNPSLRSLELCFVVEGNSTVPAPPVEKKQGRWFKGFLGSHGSSPHPQPSTVSLPGRGNKPVFHPPDVGSSQHVQMYDTQSCPFHRAAAVSATMGLDRMPSAGPRAKHRTVRGLRQALHELLRLALEESGAGCINASCFAPSLRCLLDEVTSRLLEQLPSTMDTSVESFVPRPPAFTPRSIVNATTGPPSFCMTPGTKASSARRHSSPQVAAEAANWTPLTDIICHDPRHVAECVDRVVFGRLHSCVFPFEPTDADLRFAAGVSRLAWLEPRHVEVPAQLVAGPQAERSARRLRRLYLQKSPGSILAGLAAAFREATEAGSLRAQLLEVATKNSSSDSGRPPATLGADESLPIFILLVLRANPPMFCSVLSYAENFASRAQLLTQEGYALTQAHAAVAWIESARPGDLCGLQLGEWERGLTSGGGTS
eukprot:TRINITY_DN74005_c0_g1_i1.p1 TRINITY_DN74005_c0_g1~~TRINITY_DN74005_c0_g1_i1.p1  ORF type:complete len:1270 (+),score=161.96 TRINITY_DN74005_c0_g1_i1:514-3810(+)